jgi:transcription antitermination factor NusG
MKNWFVIRSKPRKEKSLYYKLMNRDLDCYFPKFKVNPVNSRSQKEKPYFPGYMFINVNIEEVGGSTFKWMPFSNGLVCYGNDPSEVPANTFKELKNRIDNINGAGVMNNNGLEPGTNIPELNLLGHRKQEVFNEATITHRMISNSVKQYAQMTGARYAI